MSNRLAVRLAAHDDEAFVAVTLDGKRIASIEPVELDGAREILVCAKHVAIVHTITSAEYGEDTTVISIKFMDSAEGDEP